MPHGKARMIPGRPFKSRTTHAQHPGPRYLESSCSNAFTIVSAHCLAWRAPASLLTHADVVEVSEAEAMRCSSTDANIRRRRSRRSGKRASSASSKASSTELLLSDHPMLPTRYCVHQVLGIQLSLITWPRSPARMHRAGPILSRKRTAACKQAIPTRLPVKPGICLAQIY